jgi:hypothetical protein
VKTLRNTKKKMLIATYFIAVCFKEIFYQLPEDGEVIIPEHVGAM